MVQKLTLGGKKTKFELKAVPERSLASALGAEDFLADLRIVDENVVEAEDFDSTVARKNFVNVLQSVVTILAFRQKNVFESFSSD